MPRVTLTGPTTTGGSPVEVVVDLDLGARLRSIRVDDTDLLAPVPPGDVGGGEPPRTGWGSFPMAPWAGRIRHGRFRHGGDVVRLARNFRDVDGGVELRPAAPALDRPTDADDDPRAHAIHGTVYARPWTIDRRTTTGVAASCPLGSATDPAALGWPFGGVARQTITVRERAVDLSLTVESDGAAFPAVIGWHPWFPKPDALDFAPSAMYEHDELGLPTGRLIDPGPGPWDNCFLAGGPIRLRYTRAVAPIVQLTSDCDHWVVFDLPPTTTCVEPQSGPADAPNLGDGAPGAAQVVAPGSPLRRTMTIAW